MIYLQYIGVLTVAIGAISVLCDVICAVKGQFTGKAYEWHTIKVLKEKRAWWKWLLWAVFFAAGVYAIIPASIKGKADFRADVQKPEYTAYYECEYDIEHYGKGCGYAELKRENAQYTIVKIYTEDGYIQLNYTLEDNDDLEYSVALSFCYDGDSSVRLTGDPVRQETTKSCPNTEVFGYPDPTKEYCLACRDCGDGYYARCSDSSEWLCPDCTEECETICDICLEICPLWRESNDDYVICEYCLHNWFQDEALRYYFGTGEWP